MNHLTRKAIPVLLALLLAFSANADAASRKAKELLQYIPADTPYVIAYTRPLPDDLQEKFEPAMEKSLAAYRRILRLTMDAEMEKAAAEEGGTEAAEQINLLMEEILDLMSVEGLRGAGFGRGALFAMYGDGLLPVIRLAVTDIRDLEAAIERIESKAPQRFETGTIDGRSYRYADVDKLRLIIATIGKDAVVTLVPQGYSDERLGRTLGLEKPRRSMAKSKGLRDIAREYDFTDYLVGYVDVERIAASFTGDPSGLNAELLEIMDYDVTALTPQCRAEIAEMASVAPRVVLGYTRVDDDYIESEMVVELREDIAAGLATLPAVVPGLGLDAGGLMSFGFSLDPLALRNFYEARLDALEADPFECPMFAELQASTAKGREALAKPIPPVVYSFRGILANVANVEGMDFASEKPPESFDAGILFAVDNAEALVAMASLMVPEVAALNLLPDGKARALDFPQIKEFAEQAFAALSEGALSLTFGEEGEQEAEAMLSAKVDKTKPFMSFAMDARRYYEFIGEAMMEAEPEEGEEPMPEEMRVALRDAMVASGEVYERLVVNVHLTERGIELGSRMTLTN